MIGAFTEGRLRWTELIGSLPSTAMFAAVSSSTRPGLLALVRSMRPAPSSDGSAGVVRSSLTTEVLAVSISADLIWAGVQLGWADLSSTAAPALCGEDIDVPAMAWKYSPGGPDATASGVGVLPARTCTPGAVTSGL